MDFDAAIHQYQYISDTHIQMTHEVLLKLGTEHVSVNELREQLYATGDLIVEHTGIVYNEDLENAVRTFQSRNTLIVDGVVGPQTRSALNIAYSDKVKSLYNSRETWESIPRTTGKKIVINIPGFECWAYDNEVLLFKSKCIVGSRWRKTKEFSDTIRYADFRPYWNVPPGIFKRQKLPKILKYGPVYLDNNHYEVVTFEGVPVDHYTIDWEKYRTKRFPYQLRQLPGDWNALGLVKYMFPNRYNIYMHDTPDKHLFNSDRRAYSSGCVRLSEPDKFGSFILDKPVEQINNMMHDTERQHRIVSLPEQVPVHIVYMTSWIEGNKVRFAPDIYKKTETLDDDISVPHPVPHIN